jgi:hypothetical protein
VKVKVKVKVKDTGGSGPKIYLQIFLSRPIDMVIALKSSS